MSTSDVNDARYHHGDLRQSLLRAALEILQEQGAPGALSLREVARRAGVSAMAPYRHFTDKQDLLRAVAAIGFVRLREKLEDADADPDPASALLAQGVAYVVFACDNTALFRLMFGSELARRSGDLAATGEASHTVMTRRVATLVPPERANDAALQCWATVHGLASLLIDGQLASCGEPPHVLTERVLRLSKPP